MYIKKIKLLGLTLALFIGGTATSSVLAGTDQSIQIKEDVQETNQSEDDKIEPQATPLAAVGAVTAYAAGKLADAIGPRLRSGNSFSNNENVDHDEVDVIFDQ